MLESLEKVLSEKKQRMEASSVNSVGLRYDWLERIDVLYNTIKSWLEPLVDKGFAEVSLLTVAMYEENLGTYEAQAMKIIFFTGEKVDIVPKGLNVIAGNGRLDMRLGTRTVMIIGQDEEPGWFFAERVGRGKPRRFEFTQDAFEQLLQDFLETL